MPPVLRFRGLRVVIYPNDHEPAHVHVIGRDCEAKFQLNCPAGPVELIEIFGFSKREIRQILAVLRAGLSGLCEEWRRIHETE
jgi:hypothetical protein